MKERDYQLDLLRTIACLMVVLMHSPNPRSGLGSMECVGISLLTVPCIGLFFMVSGSLLLPVKMSYFDFLKRRLGKVLMPTLFFTLFYIAIAMCYGELSVSSLVPALCSIPFSAQGHGVLWFMYTLIGMYLVAPIITPFLERTTKRELQFVLLLWIITTCWPLLSLFLKVNTGNTSMLHLFSGYTGYFVLGYYLKRYPIKLSVVSILFMLILPFVACLSSKYVGWELDFYAVFWYLSIFCVMSCLAWWQIVVRYVEVRRFGIRCRLWLEDFSNCSFGIYLIHIFVMRRGIWHFSPLLNTPPHFASFNNICGYSTHLLGCSPYTLNIEDWRVSDRL